MPGDVNRGKQRRSHDVEKESRGVETRAGEQSRSAGRLIPEPDVFIRVCDGVFNKKHCSKTNASEACRIFEGAT